MFKNIYKNKYNPGPTRLSHSGGVTIIELVIVIVIFMVISSIVIFNYDNFNSTFSVQNLADDIALSVRKAQGYAIGVRGVSGIFSDSYGIHLTTNSVTPLYAGSNKSFILFADMNSTPNKKYDYDSFDKCGSPIDTNECLELLSIKTADRITGIYLENNTNPISSTSTVDILFNRPNPEPTFCYRNNPASTLCDSGTISFIKIIISNMGTPQVTKTITIYNNGQISVF